MSLYLPTAPAHLDDGHNDHPAQPLSAAAAGHIVALAMRIANRAVLADITNESTRVDLGDGHRWYDIRPMLDNREHSGPSIDMAGEAIAYALDCRLVTRHPVHASYVCITQ